MKIYFDPVTNGFYQTDFHKNIPSTAIEISNDLRWNLLEGEANGKTIVVVDGVPTLQEKIPSIDEQIQTERNWRDFELRLADIELNKVQDSDSKSVGTVAQWREYRKALRAWPEHKEFPDTRSRPISPITIRE